MGWAFQGGGDDARGRRHAEDVRSHAQRSPALVDPTPGERRLFGIFTEDPWPGTTPNCDTNLRLAFFKIYIWTYSELEVQN